MTVQLVLADQPSIVLFILLQLRFVNIYRDGISRLFFTITLSYLIL